ncbi:hypothetical protein IWQ61_006168 [Dispira simplex]|nr:hypothetical protein IWQ61_006168 [Dispira simplex]
MRVTRSYLGGVLTMALVYDRGVMGNGPTEAMAPLARLGTGVRGKFVFKQKKVDDGTFHNDRLPKNVILASTNSRYALEMYVELEGLRPDEPYEPFILNNEAPRDGSCNSLGQMFGMNNGQNMGSISIAKSPEEMSTKIYRRNVSPEDTNQAANLTNGETNDFADGEQANLMGKFGDPSPFEMCRKGDLQDKFGPFVSTSTKFSARFTDPNLEIPELISRSVAIWDGRGELVACGTIGTDMNARASTAATLRVPMSRVWLFGVGLATVATSWYLTF